MEHMFSAPPDCHACLSIPFLGIDHNDQSPFALRDTPLTPYTQSAPGLLDRPCRSSSPSLSSCSTLPSTEHGCLDCVAECNDECLSVNAIKTSMCTDQCIVVACSNSEHSSKATCHQEDSHTKCEYACDIAEACVDCTGWDSLCCADATPYPVDHLRPANSFNTPDLDISWDPCLVDFLCECREMMGDNCPSTRGLYPLTPEQSPSSSPTSDAELPPSPPSPISMSGPHTLDFMSSVLPQYTSTQPSHHVNSQPVSPGLLPSTPEELFDCMWGDCQLVVPTLSELVKHVNLQHLHLPSNHQPSVFALSSCTDPNQLCPWRYCNLPLVSISEPSGCHPGTIAENQHFENFSLLTNHLLQDHLGLSALGSSQTFQSTLQKINTSPAGVFSQTPTISSLEYRSSNTQSKQCHESHPCLWMGCGKTFSTCDEVTSHLTTIHVGSGKAQYECCWENCNRNGENGFGSKQKICRHLQSHTGHRPFQCELCQQNFSEAATLQQHMRRHTQEKPYICDFPGCGKCFAIAGALTIHKRIHNGQKPFKCTYCDRAFAESSNLSKHLRTHTGARPYHCLYVGCGKSFARPDQLTRHVGVHKRKQLDKQS